MKVTVTGASGFIGQRLVEKLIAAGHAVHALGRKRSATLPQSVAFSQWNAAEEPALESLAGSGAVIHLAGESVVQRWTPEAKARIRGSRIDGTRHLVNALSTQSPRPEVLVSASAIGIYGSRGDETLTEESEPGGRDFLSRGAIDWENAALLAEALGIRVVLLRFGIVLGNGGALAKMLPPLRLGIGGRIGSGKQWMSWIHIEDATDMILFAIQNRAVNGPVNATAPKPVTNAEFTRALAKAIHRPAILPVPPFALKMLFGEMASMMLASQRVLPAAAHAAGFRFQYPQLEPALARLVSGGPEGQ